jgi:hydrogenase maturation protease
VRILAVGSPYCDDQAGWQALERLRLEHLPGVEMTALATPVEILDYLQGCRVLVILDACHSGSPPGSILRLSWPLTAADGPHRTSSHGLDVVAMIALAEALGMALPPITLLGIEMGEHELTADLSPAVRDGLPELCRRALDEVSTHFAPSPSPVAQPRGREMGQGDGTPSSAATEHA